MDGLQIISQEQNQSKSWQYKQSQVKAQKNKYKTKRKRAKKDPAMERKYLCKCGLAYLTSAAVNRHIKLKHDGDKAEFRIKLELPQQIMKQQEAPKIQLFQPLKKKQKPIKTNPSRDSLKVLVDLMGKNLPFNSQPMFTLQPAPAVVDYIKTINLNYELHKTQKQNADISNKLSINDVFYQFFTDMDDYVSYQGTYYVCLFLYSLKNLINQSKSDQNYCLNNGPNQLPQFFNQYIMQKKAPNFQPYPKTEHFWLVFAVKFIMGFTAWLKQRKYTRFKVEITKIPEDIQSQPPAS